MFSFLQNALVFFSLIKILRLYILIFIEQFYGILNKTFSSLRLCCSESWRRSIAGISMQFIKCNSHVFKSESTWKRSASSAIAMTFDAEKAQNYISFSVLIFGGLERIVRIYLKLINSKQTIWLDALWRNCSQKVLKMFGF